MNMPNDNERTFFDFFRHLSAMCTACILVIFALLQWRGPGQPPAGSEHLLSAFTDFTFSLGASLFIMAFIAFRISTLFDLTDEKSAKKNDLHGIINFVVVIAVVIAFFLSVFSFCEGLYHLYHLLDANLADVAAPVPAA
jgi:hypothetical protein